MWWSLRCCWAHVVVCAKGSVLVHAASACCVTGSFKQPASRQSSAVSKRCLGNRAGRCPCGTATPPVAENCTWFRCCGMGHCNFCCVMGVAPAGGHVHARARQACRFYILVSSYTMMDPALTRSHELWVLQVTSGSHMPQRGG